MTDPYQVLELPAGRRRRGDPGAIPGAGPPLAAGAGAGAVRRGAGRLRAGPGPGRPAAAPALRRRPGGEHRRVDRGGRMPDPTPPGDAGGAAGRPPGPLTPHADRRGARRLPPVAGGVGRGEPEASATVYRPVADAPGSPGRRSGDDRRGVHGAAARGEPANEGDAGAVGAVGGGTRPHPAPADNSDDDAATRPLVKAVAEAYDTLTRTTVGDRPASRELSAAPPSFWGTLCSAAAIGRCRPPRRRRHRSADERTPGRTPHARRRPGTNRDGRPAVRPGDDGSGRSRRRRASTLRER